MTLLQRFCRLSAAARARELRSLEFQQLAGGLLQDRCRIGAG